MAQLLYFAFPGSERPQGGIKMVLRHVETLRELGFDAWCVIGSEYVLPTWIEHRAPILRHVTFNSDHVVVLPDERPHALLRTRQLGLRTVIFAQNGYVMAANEAIEAIDSFLPDALPPFITVGPHAADFIRRLYPQAQIEIAPCFVDERRFRPAAAKETIVTTMPKKRPLEARAVRHLFRKLHPRYAGVGWFEIDFISETATAEALGRASLHMSLARLESFGLSALEAMACGGVCAGFLGRGGVTYATADNGFWVEDEDCVGAADALAQAADLVATGGPALARMVDAGRATAEAWSYARFRKALEEVWMRLAPDARIGRGPLDA